METAIYKLSNTHTCCSNNHFQVKLG